MRGSLGELALAGCMGGLLLACSAAPESGGANAGPGDEGVEPSEPGGVEPMDGATVDAPAAPVEQGQPLPEGMASDRDAGGADVPADSLADAAFFRATALSIVEPGIVVRPFGLQTDVSVGAQTAVDLSLTQDNETITDRGLEGGADGIVDLTLLFRFDAGADPSADGGAMAMGGGRCPAPLGSAPCAEEQRAPLEPLNFVNLDVCPVTGTDYETPGRCFNVNADGIVLEIIGIGNIPLERVTVVGQYAGDPVSELREGVIHGFLSEQTANETKLPEALPALAEVIGITGDKPVREFLSDDDLSTDGQGASGWWFTVEYSAGAIEFVQ